MFKSTFLLLCLMAVFVTKCTSREDQATTTKISKDKQVKGHCRDKAKWCPCMADDCHKLKVAKKCPETCSTCSNEVPDEEEERPGFSFGVEAAGEDEEEWDEIEEDTEEDEWDTIEEDPDRPDVYLYDCRHEIRQLDCRCLITILHKKFLCYHHDKPPFGKYEVSKAAQYHHYCYKLGHDKERGRKQCCRATESFREIRGC